MHRGLYSPRCNGASSLFSIFRFGFAAGPRGSALWGCALIRTLNLKVCCDFFRGFCRPGMRDRSRLHGKGRGLHERARLRCEGWSGLAGHMQGSPPKVRRIGVLFWRAPPLLMSLCCFRHFRSDQMACAPVHVSPGAICLNYAVKLRARLVSGAPWCVSSWCLANVPDVKR